LHQEQVRDTSLFFIFYSTGTILINGYKSQNWKIHTDLLWKKSRASSAIAQIRLYNAANQHIGAMYFYKEGKKIPNNTTTIVGTPKRVYLHASENQLDGVVDMLRNEKPCSVYYYGPTNAYLYTGKEPIGEEET